MTNTDAEGKRGDAPAQGAPAGGVAVPPQRASDRPGYGGVDEAGLGAGSGAPWGGDLGAGGDLSGDVGGLDDDDHSPDG